MPSQRTLVIDAQNVRLEEHEPGYFLGTLLILGTPHHFELIEVAEREDETASFTRFVQEPVIREPEPYSGQDESANLSRYDDMQHSYDGIYQAVNFDGRTFVCRVHPYCQ